jgi:predicted  nucleic acid-binding Zn-ribbon protein
LKNELAALRDGKNHSLREDVTRLSTKVEAAETDVTRALGNIQSTRSRLDSFSSDVAKQFREAQAHTNELFNENQKQASHVNGKLRDLLSADQQLLERIDNLAKSLDRLQEHANDMGTPTVAIEQVVTSSGEIDLSPILKQLKARHESQQSDGAH